LREVANTHTEAATAREATLQAKVEAAQKIHHVKKVVARQAEKVASLKEKLEVVEQKPKDAADDLQVVVECKFVRSPKIDSMFLLGLFAYISTLNGFRHQGDRGRPEERAGRDQGSSEDPQGEDHGGPAG
jgi:hypothetical protein